MDRATVTANIDAFIEQHLALIESVKTAVALCKEQQEIIKHQAERITALEKELRQMKAAAARSQFGRSSEQDIEGQMALPFNPELEGALAVRIESEIQEAIDEAATKKPKKKRGGRIAIPEHFVRDRRVYEMSTAELDEKFGKGQWREAGEEIREELEYKPGTLIVIEHVTKKYTSKDRSSAPIRAESPNAVIAKGRPGPNLLAHILISKYGDHLPLYRIEKILNRNGIKIPRTTMCHWVQQCSMLLSGIVGVIKAEILAGDIVRTDATNVLMLDKNAKNGGRKTYIFPYMSHDDLIVFEHSEKHNHGTVKSFLSGFKGYLQADAASIYDKLFGKQIIEVACWAHARRKFFEAKDDHPDDGKTAMALIRKLYEIERYAKDNDLGIEEIRTLRQKNAKPLLATIKEWMEGRQLVVLPKSSIGIAFAYALNHFEALETYVEDGRLKIDNNGVEREIRQVALGRKNFLFFGGLQGGKSAAIIYSLIANCKLEGINPQEYLADVLSRISKLKAKDASSITPRNWRLARETECSAAAAD